MGRPPCLGDLLTPQKPRQFAKKSRGSRPVFLLSHLSSKSAKQELRPLRGAHRQFVVDLSVFCRRGLCPPLGIAGRSRLLQDCPAGATFPGAVPEKCRFYLCNFSAPCAHLVEFASTFG